MRARFRVSIRTRVQIERKAEKEEEREAGRCSTVVRYYATPIAAEPLPKLPVYSPDCVNGATISR